MKNFNRLIEAFAYGMGGILAWDYLIECREPTWTYLIPEDVE